MNKLYPLKFKPIYKTKLWGGYKIKNMLQKADAPENCGESWEISTVEENVSVVSSGFLEGNTLTELIEIYMGELVGEKIFQKFGMEFPLLIKFIDATDDLSIQVHPNDLIAKERHNAYGKTEMWYIIDHEKSATLINGFNQESDPVSFLKALEQNTISNLLNYQEVKNGDVYFIPSGRLHAIGKGILLAEIQQTSDVTYRVYDYNRKEKDGTLRDLHIDESIDVIDYNKNTNVKNLYKHDYNKSVSLVKCNYFNTNFLDLTEPKNRDFELLDSFVVYLCTDGQAEIIYDQGEKITISKGETVLIPNSISEYTLSPTPNATLLEIYID